MKVQILQNSAMLIRNILFLCMLTVIGCQSRDDFPPYPKIEFEDYQKHTGVNGNDTAITLEISFKHGHAEMGLNQDDTMPPFNEEPYQNNFFIEYYEKVEGEFQQVRQTSGGISNPNAPFINFHSRFPDITPSGKNKATQGKLKRDIPGFETIKSDTIQFKIWIVDRNLEESNKVYSPEIEISG